MRWADRSVFTFRLGGVSCSYSLIELGRRLLISAIEETLTPHFYAYLYSYITEPPQEYNYMSIWGHSR